MAGRIVQNEKLVLKKSSSNDGGYNASWKILELLDVIVPKIKAIFSMTSIKQRLTIEQLSIDVEDMDEALEALVLKNEMNTEALSLLSVDLEIN